MSTTQKLSHGGQFISAATDLVMCVIISLPSASEFWRIESRLSPDPPRFPKTYGGVICPTSQPHLKKALTENYQLICVPLAKCHQTKEESGSKNEREVQAAQSKKIVAIAAPIDLPLPSPTHRGPSPRSAVRGGSNSPKRFPSPVDYHSSVW